MLQEYIEHGGVLFKVYIIGDAAVLSPRPSIQRMDLSDSDDVESLGGGSGGGSSGNLASATETPEHSLGQEAVVGTPDTPATSGPSTELKFFSGVSRRRAAAPGCSTHAAAVSDVPLPSPAPPPAPPSRSAFRPRSHFDKPSTGARKFLQQLQQGQEGGRQARESDGRRLSDPAGPVPPRPSGGPSELVRRSGLDSADPCPPRTLPTDRPSSLSHAASAGAAVRGGCCGC